jgi:hypothetical protein
MALQKPFQRLPAKPGTILGMVPKDVLSSPTLTPLERQVIEQAGVAAVGKVPDLTQTAVGKRLTAEIARIRNEASNVEGLTPVPPDTPPIQVPPIRDIHSLSPVEQRQVYTAMDEMLELRQAIQASQQPPPPTPQVLGHIPGGQEALTLAQHVAAQATVSGGPIEIVDDLADQPVAPEPVTPPATPDPEIAPVDKMLYIQAIHGGRFIKEYSLFGGQVVVTFRAPSPTDTDMILDQLDADCSSGAISTPTQYDRWAGEYAMAVSLMRLHHNGSAPINLMEPAQYAKANQRTPLPALREYVASNVLLSESVRRAVRAAYKQFSDLLALLDSKAGEPDFWTAIETRG